MSRVINPNTAGKQRKQIVRAIVVALRALMAQTAQDQETQDIVAFIALGLVDIDKSVEMSITPWEKRGYWLKADRYRLDWEWAGRLAQELRQAILAEDWLNIARISAEVAEKVQSTQVPKRHRIGRPWVGAWQQFQEQVT